MGLERFSGDKDLGRTADCYLNKGSILVSVNSLETRFFLEGPLGQLKCLWAKPPAPKARRVSDTQCVSGSRAKPWEIFGFLKAAVKGNMKSLNTISQNINAFLERHSVRK